MSLPRRVRTNIGLTTLAKLGCASAFAIALVQAPASAQAVPEGADAGDGTIYVTATKRPETVQHAPIAISAIDEEAIRNSGITSVADLQSQTPSLQVAVTPGVTNVFVRGIGSNIPGGALNGGVSTYVDGVYQAHPAAADLAQIDLGSIEVLRGPQGTLYGRNATGGVVSFFSKAPTSDFEGYIKAGYAEHDELSGEAMVNVPWADGARSRLVVAYRDRDDGFIKNTAGGPDADFGHAFSARFRTDFDLSDTAKLGFNLYYTDERSSPYSVPLAPSPLLTLFGQVFPSEKRQTTQNRPGRMTRTEKGGNMTLDWDLGFADLKSITSYSRHAPIITSVDSDGSNVDFSAETRGAFISKTFVQQVELSGTIGRLEWLAGTFYMHDKLKQNLDLALPGFGVTILTQQRNKTESMAGFVDLIYNVTDQFRVLGGARLSRDEVTAKISQTVFGIPDQCALLTPDYDSTTWRVGAQYLPSRNTNLYATVTRGFKGGGVSGCTTAAGPDLFDPEVVTSYEIGLKQQLWDQRLSLSAAAFHYDYTGLQVFHVDVATLQSTIDNAASATVDGLELEAVLRPDKRFTLGLGATFLDAEYERYDNFDTLNPAAGVQDLSGNRMNSAPRAGINASAQYIAPIGSMGRLTFRVEGRYSSRVFYREFDNRADSQRPFGVGNAYIVWDSADDKWMARLFAKNFTNTAYLQSLAAAGAPVSARYVVYAPPRQIGFDLTRRF